MKRKSPFWFLLLAFFATMLSFFVVVENRHGFPFAWAYVSANPITEFPFIGDLFGWLPPSVGFDWLSFLLDVGVFFAAFWGLYWFAKRKKR